MKINNFILLSLLLLCLSINSYGKAYFPLEQIGDIIAEEINLTTEVIGLEQDTKLDNSAWKFSILRFRVITKVGFEIDWLLAARIEPEIEIYITR